ncbi:MAG: hypothetical protein RL189_2645 [Pseudomonadota bacterium]|jgi:hypothetical protein
MMSRCSKFSQTIGARFRISADGMLAERKQRFVKIARRSHFTLTFVLLARYMFHRLRVVFGR